MNENETLVAPKIETAFERFIRDDQIKEISLLIKKDNVLHYLKTKIQLGLIELKSDSSVDAISNDIEKTALITDRDLSRSLFFPNARVGSVNLPIRSLFFLSVNGGSITKPNNNESLFEYNRDVDIKKVSSMYPDIFGTNITVRSNYRRDTNEYVYAMPTLRVILSSLLVGTDSRRNNEIIETSLLKNDMSMAEYDSYYMLTIKEKDARKRRELQY